MQKQTRKGTKTQKGNTKMTITEKQLSEISKIKELNFRKIRNYSERSNASAIIELDLSKVKGKARNLLIEFFKSKYYTKKGERVRTVSIFEQKEKKYLIVEYYQLHGFGYAWSQDLKYSFIDFIIENYKINKKSKSFINLLHFEFSF